MSIRQISSRIQLSFWQMVISLLSESRTSQQLVRWFYLKLFPVAENIFARFERQKVYRWAAAGLGTGFIIGLLITLV